MGMLRRKRKLEFQLGDIKNMRKQRCFEDIEIKNLSGISQQRKKAAIGHVALDGYVLASETYPWTEPDGVKDLKSKREQS